MLSRIRVERVNGPSEMGGSGGPRRWQPIITIPALLALLFGVALLNSLSAGTASAGKLADQGAPGTSGTYQSLGGGCSSCNLSVTFATITCNLDGSVHWTANVTNSGDCDVVNNWKVQFQVEMPGGNVFQTWGTRRGTRTFAPGNTVMQGDLCYEYPQNANAIRIELSLDTNSTYCNPHVKSAAMPPCVQVSPCGGVPSDSATK